MKRTVAFSSMLVFVLVLTATVPAVFSQDSPATPANGWFWGPTLTCAQVFSGQFDDQIVVVEGQVGAKVDPQEWNIYLFSDGTATINANFGDGVPAKAIPQDSTVRVIGKADSGEVDVEGLQTLGATSATPSATVAQINAGTFDGQDVVVKGLIGDQDPGFPGWNYYNFSDGTGTVLVDLADELTSDQIPQNQTLLLFGKVEDKSGQREIDSELMLLAEEGEPPPAYDYTIFLPLMRRTSGS